MDKFSAYIEKRIAPVAGKIASQKYVQVIQNVFLNLIPFMTIGSFALIISSPAMDYTTLDPGFVRSFFKGWQALADFVQVPLGSIYFATMECISLAVCAGVGYYLAKHYKINSYIPVALSLASFMIVGGVTEKGALTTEYFNGTGLFSAIVISIVAVEFYRFLTERKIGKIELSSAGVPPALTDSLASLVPIAIVFLSMGILSAIVMKVTGGPFPNLMFKIMEPVVGLVDNVWGVLILALLVMFFWWFGIHDTVITGPLSPFLINNLTANSSAYAAGTAAIALPYILTEPFWWTFMTIGGSGATFGLAILCLRSKSKQIRTVGKLAIVPAFFNINEPLIFGLPLMFNPIMMFPFITSLALNGVITYLLMDFQIVARTFANPSWNMFSPIGALLSTMDFKAVLLVIGLIILDVLLYLPFFKIYEKQKIKEEQQEEIAVSEG